MVEPRDTNLGAGVLVAKHGIATSTNAPALRYNRNLVPLAGYPTATDDLTVAIGTRLDPYWADIWPVGSKAAWVSAKSAAAQVAAGIGRLPAYLRSDPKRAKKTARELATNPKNLDTLAVLDSWRTATGEQLACFTGQLGLASGKSPAMTALFGANLVDVGIFSNGLFTTRNTARGALYRPATGTVFEQHVVPEMTYTEWVQTTGAITNRIGGGQHDRHNVIATELALRVAEVCDVGNVLGEKMSTADLLGYTSLGLPSKGPGYTRAADFTIVRQDGLRIAIEITASVGRALDAKVRHWAELLAERRMDDSGLAVLFVLVDKPNKERGGTNAVRNAVYKLVRETVRNTPGVSFDRVASKMGIADWREWFPKSGYVSPSFFTLEADRPTGPHDDLWERMSFLDEDELPFHPKTSWATDALNNISMLRSTPYWLRGDRKPPEMYRALLKLSGRTEVPQVGLSRPDINPGTRPFGKAFGFVGDTKPPKRIRSER
jgi:hypothetical protein